MERDFNVDCVGWKFVGSLETSDFRKRRFWALVSFLQENGLTTRTVANSLEEVTEASCLKRSDLTEEGLALVKIALEKWLKALDRRKHKDPENVTILRRSLTALRGDTAQVQ